jgi:hypothetical protein
VAARGGPELHRRLHPPRLLRAMCVSMRACRAAPGRSSLLQHACTTHACMACAGRLQQRLPYVDTDLQRDQLVVQLQLLGQKVGADRGLVLL